MLVVTRVPAPPLSDHVAMLWLYDGWTPTCERERALPDGSVEIVVNLRENETRLYDANDLSRVERHGGAVVCGPHSRFFVIDGEEQTSVAGVHFKPGGASPFFGRPLTELADRHVSLDLLWGPDAGLLREQALAARTPEARLDVLEAALARRLHRARERHPAVRYALAEFRRAAHAGKVGEVSDAIGLSARRFIEVFKGEVGLAPKVFCRVRRFQRVLRRIHRRREIAWADVAVSGGYFDQAHFIHDFRAFSGINPTEYLAAEGRHPNHVPVR